MSNSRNVLLHHVPRLNEFNFWRGGGGKKKSSYVLLSSMQRETTKATVGEEEDLASDRCFSSSLATLPGMSN